MREKIEDKFNPLMRPAERTESSNDHAARDTEKWNHGEHKDLKWVARKFPLAEEGKFGYMAEQLTEAAVKLRAEREAKDAKEKEEENKRRRDAALRPDESKMIEQLSKESGVSKEDIMDEEEYEEEEQAIDHEGRPRRIVVKKKRPRKR